MTIETVGRLLKLSDQADAAVLAFECSDYNMAYAACRAAELTGKPHRDVGSVYPVAKRTCPTQNPLRALLKLLRGDAKRKSRYT